MLGWAGNAMVREPVYSKRIWDSCWSFRVATVLGSPCCQGVHLLHCTFANRDHQALSSWVVQ